MECKSRKIQPILFPDGKVTDSQVALVVNNPPANAGDTRDEVRSLGQEDPLEKEMTTHSSILACRIPWAEEPGVLQRSYSPWDCKSWTQLK